MPLKKALLLLLCTVFVSAVMAQPLAVYTNMQNQVIVWDRGIMRKVDYLPPVEVKTGRTAIPYLDNSRSFKIYYKGGARTVNAGFTNEFVVSDNLIAFLNAKSLKVFDNGNIKDLSTFCTQYYMGDSVLMFFDGVRSEYKAYYNGTVYPIEGFLAGNPLEVVKVSDNIAAYDNYANQFRIFYHGNIIEQEDYAVSSFEVGRNTVAYVDINRQFKIFHNGKTYLTEEFPPSAFQVGDNVAAYVSNDGYFKVFYGDSVRSLGFFTPEFRVADNMVTYRDPGGYFKVFYKGDIYTLESYYPEKTVVQYNSIAYVNRANILRLFTEGEIYDVTNAELESWQLNYDVIKYQIGRNMFRIYYKGTEYSQ
ncbi:MAG: hypothetical protein EOP56_09550 [Sphingobacteriales bacterium]|nr:MAG: hypothetical protein EOP56_09550 [Sphingobacteriales bacterium]